ncbi:glucan 1,3-beta-glucosidase, partial [Auriculariales sp. MPI-PUGE-AT-0066]
MVRFSLSMAAALVASLDAVLGLGTSCSTPLGAGTAASGSPYWLVNMPARGKSAFNSDSSYTVRRNVKDFMIPPRSTQQQRRFQRWTLWLWCGQSTITPAVVYFPPGTYRISTPIINYYYSAFIGDGRSWPTIQPFSNFTGAALIDAAFVLRAYASIDPDLGNDVHYYVNQNNFYRSLRNIILDLRTLPYLLVSQATLISGLRILMSEDASTNQVGMWMENGSGGYMGDITVSGGKMGLNLGNQQFTTAIYVIGAGVRQLPVRNVWLFFRVSISNCPVGFKLNTGSTTSAQTTGASVIADATFTNVGTAVQTTTNQPSTYASGFALDNVVFASVTNGVADLSGNVALAGGSKTVAQWVQGSVYSGTSSTFSYVRGATTAFNKPASLLENGKIVSRPRPQYETYDASQFVSVKALGAKGDGTTDDTAIIKSILAQYAGCKIIFFDHGTYLVNSTITIPAGTQIIGEAWTEIMGYGSAFQSASSPQVVVRVGDAGSTGVVEITDILFTTRGPAPGAIIVEWNVHDPSGVQAASGMWDSIIRIGGAAGTNLQASGCAKGTQNAACMGAFLSLHLKSGSTAYLEGLWVWTADHDVETGNTSSQISVFSGRGVLSETAGPVWIIGGGSEHNVLVQYNFAGASNHFLGVLQTESPYYQPSPVPPAPFS